APTLRLHAHGSRSRRHATAVGKDCGILSEASGEAYRQGREASDNRKFPILITKTRKSERHEMRNEGSLVWILVYFSLSYFRDCFGETSARAQPPSYARFGPSHRSASGISIPFWVA